jgi:hypothetical protein
MEELFVWLGVIIIVGLIFYLLFRNEDKSNDNKGPIYYDVE